MTTPEDISALLGSLPVGDADAFAILAIHEPPSVTAWCDLARFGGASGPLGRAYDTKGIRAVFERLADAGLAVAPGTAFRVPVAARVATWRWLATHPRHQRALGLAKARDTLSQARAAVFTEAPTLEAFRRLGEIDPVARDVVAAEATEARDEAWLAAMDPALRASLVEHALLHVEHTAAPWLGAYEHVAATPERLADASIRARDAFAGIALLRGDFDDVTRAVDASADGSSRPLLAAALAFARGQRLQTPGAIRAVGTPTRGAHMGVASLLAALALHAERAELGGWPQAGTKRGAPFAGSFALLASVKTGKSPSSKFRPDPCSLLVTAMLARERVSLSLDQGLDLARSASSYGSQMISRGHRWLGEQHVFAACLFARLLGPSAARFLDPPPTPPAAPLAPAIFDATPARARWEIDLDHLESLAASEDEAAAKPDTTTAERVTWRVGPHLSLDPYIQKRGAGGAWTAGRKLAIKHLLGGAKGLALPSEDVAVARHAREVREGGGYYANVYHTLADEAWSALVGHPRVTDEQGRPVEVVAGVPKIVTKPAEGGVNVRLEPPLTAAGVHPVRSEQHVVVYEVPPRKSALYAALSRTTFVPDAGRERLATFLARIAGAAMVETEELTSARTVTAAPTIHARLIAAKGALGGLSISLLVRPLGPGTTPLTAGSGATTVVARVGTETLQAERDLDVERNRAEEVVQACPELVTAEVGTFAWRVVAPEDALAVVSALQRLGDRVVVEWPHGAPIRVRPRLSRKSLRGSLASRPGSFWFAGELRVADDLALDVVRALELLAEHPGRFIAIGENEYVELEAELRDVLAAMEASRAPRTTHDKGAGVSIARAAIGVLEALTEDDTITCDGDTQAWRARIDDAFRRAANVPKTLQGELRDYQVEGYRWLSRLANAGLGACLADDMGLGKTVQIIALLLQRAAGGPALVVAPTSVCDGWRREIERFAPSLNVRAAFGAERAPAMQGWKRRHVVVTSYTLLHQHAEHFHSIEWATVVLDEAQFVKNAETLRAKAALGLRAEARVVATGTPIENHAGDLYSLFQFLNPGLLGTQKAFLSKIGAEGHLSRATKRLVQPFILRRTKAEVLDDLPPVTEIQRSVELSAAEAKLYDTVRKSALAKLGRGGAAERIQIFAELTRLRRLCCHPSLVAPDAGLGSSKLESFIELAEELVQAGHRALVFSQFTDVLALVKPLLDARGIRYQYLDGSTPPARRTAAVDAFQGGEGDVFLISLKAGGFGLNLTAADYVVHLDPWWNPAVEAQASDRAHRIGQTRPVTVYRLVTLGTIEERIVALHRDKREVAAAVLEDTDRSAKLSATEMRALLEG